MRLFFRSHIAEGLFDFAFFEIHVLADHRIILLLDHFLGHVPGVLFSDVEKACISRAVQTDLDGGWLSHA